jgi:UDP-N-acetylglucosamine--N-acetylmuramyl-(pentapeptide) pyrophosphoryl-undecaprenol N-acetylglucosamine transferase
MRVLIAAGGTGGHVIPALHVAAELRDRGADVLAVGTSRGLEARLVPERGFPLETIAISGLNRVGIAQTVSSMLQLPRALLDSAAIVERFRPDVAYGVGAYISGPVLLMAACRGVPIVVHEANAVPGFANRLLAPIVSRALLADGAAARFFPSTRVEITGLPVNRAFFEIAPKAHNTPYTVLITGGSQGSSRMNGAVIEALDLLPRDEFRWLHQTGHQRFDAVRQAYEQRGRLCAGGDQVSAFLSDMPASMARADLVIARAGASTLAELAAAGKAAILAPFPFASDDHQFHNALARQRAGAARVVRDAELTGGRLVAEMRAILPELTQMEENARRFAVVDATERIADAIEAAAF